MGVPLYNGGDALGCFNVYEACCIAIAEELTGPLKNRVMGALMRSKDLSSASDQAWELRRALDEVAAAASYNTIAQGRDSAPQATAPQAPDSSTLQVVDFTQPDEAGKWRCINDGVMGGRSSSQISYGEGFSVFEGVLSEANNGGFASCKGPTVNWDLLRFRGLAIQHLGDGQRYKLQVRTEQNVDSVVYQADVDTTGEWETTEVSWGKFVPTWRGNVVRQAPPLTGAEVRSVGLIVSKLSDSGLPNPHFRPGNFRLLLKFIRPF